MVADLKKFRVSCTFFLTRFFLLDTIEYAMIGATSRQSWLLRCCVMKHLKGWSFRDLERELRSNLVYRQFTHFDADPTPNFSTFSRTFALLSPVVTEQIHQRVVGLAREKG